MESKEEDFSVSDTICEDDMICLSCVSAAVTKDGVANGERVCLAAEGFGNRMCSLQNMANKDLPADIGVCVFVLEQALSVRALQEMVSAQSQEAVGQSGHRTLLYGHAVLLRHSHSNMYLACLSTQSSSTDKLAFDVGLMEEAKGESCWWTIHPASKQRSEGEKVRVGDDLILVSVASERYMHIGAGSMVIASFQQTLWTVQPVCSGAVRQKSLGYVFGGDVLRLLHGDECLTIPPREADGSHYEPAQDVQSIVMYEAGSVSSHARSLWRLEHIRTKWAEGFMGWGQPCRLRHITSGRYLAITDDNQVITAHRKESVEAATAFLLRQTKDDKKVSEQREDEGMGTADIKYGDSLVYVQHMSTGLWLSYQTFETKKRGIGRVEMKKAIVMVEGHMDDGVTFSRAQEEESKSARVIRKCTSLIARFIKALDSLKVEGRQSQYWAGISLAEVIMTLTDLIDYFAPPGEDVEFEERQAKLKALKNRQDLFQEEGMITMILETIDKCSQWRSLRALAHVAGEDAASKWDDMLNYLYLLLAAMIQGNRANCSQFAASNRLDWLVDRLESQQSSSGVLDVLHSVLVNSPEALNVIKEKHIKTIISLIDKHGRDPKVLDVLCSLCVGNDIAVRSNQNLICDNLLPGRDLLLQTKLVDHVHSMHPNIFVGVKEGSALYRKWYFEVVIDHVETVSHTPPHIRIGWANTEGFLPFPGAGEHWGCNGVGDDLYSYGFDGINLWTGGKPKRVRTLQQGLQKGDTIGISLDLTIPQITFTVNGIRVKGFFKDFNVDGMFYPVISMSAKVSCRFIFGGDQGKLRYAPPDEHVPVYESLVAKEKLCINPSFHFGEVPKGIVSGPLVVQEYTAFVPKPVETGHVQLPMYIENVRDKLAENIHEQWAMGKIENGWSYAEHRDDHRKNHPCLTNFDRLPTSEKTYNLSLAFETLRTLLALGYHITYNPQIKEQGARLKTLKLGNNFLQSNGYKPTPLDLSGVQLDERMMELVDQLAENTHNVWARERIKQGWTYGLHEDVRHKRSPHLVPYSKVDESIKKANREMASETVRTLMAYGYNLEPPTNEAGEMALTKDTAEKKTSLRTYRAELTYTVDSGKWYYELEVNTTGFMMIGWAHVNAVPHRELGCDGMSYVFDGYAGRKWHQGSEAYGKIWRTGDVIGVMLDIVDKTICFSLNGELMMDPMGQEIAFKGIDIGQGFVPCIALGPGQVAKLNFGQDVNSLKFFTTYGLQEGYEPFCVNMTKQMPMWYAREQALFNPLCKNHQTLEVQRVPGGSSAPPCLKVLSKNYGTLEKVQLDFLRLSLPVKCHDQLVPPRDKAAVVAALEHKLQDSMNREDSYAADLAEGAHKRGRTDDVSRTKHKRDQFKTKSLKSKSYEEQDGPSGKTKIKHGTSETDLLSVPTEKTAKGALLDKFADVSKKSPFSLFKKQKSREPSPQTTTKKKKVPTATLR